MEKPPMCRICLVKNVRMFIVTNRNLHELYEKLTDVPFVTDDRRPMLACFVCCAKLKQCYRLLRQCLEAEELFAQKMNEDYEPNSLINQDGLDSYGGFIKTAIENINIVDVVQTDSIAIKEEFPAVCERLDNIIEPKEEHESHHHLPSLFPTMLGSASNIKEEYQSDELEPENLDNSYLKVADRQPQRSESDSEDDVPLMVFKTEVEEEDVSKKKRRARETTRTTGAKKPKLDTRRTRLEDAITAEETKNDNSDAKVIRTTKNERTSEPGTYLKQPYICDICQRGFSLKRTLTKHFRIHSGEKPFKCDTCQHSFREKSNLISHIRTHTGEKPYKCDICQYSFSRKGLLTEHIRIHTGETPYKCDICQRSYNRKRLLTKHIRKHTGETPYKCDVCQRSFSEKKTLTNHIRIHTGEKPFICDICKCSFRDKNTLKSHIRIHMGKKPYICDVCQRNFREKHHLSEHIRVHTDEKPYKCDICQLSFSRKRFLTKHLRIHTGETPYKCDMCHHSFRAKSTLTKHIRYAHR